MYKTDFTKLSRKQLLKHFEQERQEWLSAGMSEAEIYRIHYGEETEKGKGGDYRMWLDERRHTRPDHKYAPGTPVSFEAVDPNNAWISGGRGGLDDVDFNIDVEAMLSKLPIAQRELAAAIIFDGLTSAEYAKQKNINKSTVSRALERVRKKLKKYFFEGN